MVMNMNQIIIIQITMEVSYGILPINWNSEITMKYNTDPETKIIILLTQGEIAA